MSPDENEEVIFEIDVPLADQKQYVCDTTPASYRVVRPRGRECSCVVYGKYGHSELERWEANVSCRWLVVHLLGEIERTNQRHVRDLEEIERLNAEIDRLRSCKCPHDAAKEYSEAVTRQKRQTLEESLASLDPPETPTWDPVGDITKGVSVPATPEEAVEYLTREVGSKQSDPPDSCTCGYKTDDPCCPIHPSPDVAKLRQEIERLKHELEAKCLWITEGKKLLDVRIEEAEQLKYENARLTRENCLLTDRIEKPDTPAEPEREPRTWWGYIPEYHPNSLRCNVDLSVVNRVRAITTEECVEVREVLRDEDGNEIPSAEVIELRHRLAGMKKAASDGILHEHKGD